MLLLANIDLIRRRILFNGRSLSQLTVIALTYNLAICRKLLLVSGKSLEIGVT